MADKYLNKRIGAYTIMEKIGRGGMAKVYKAQQVNLDRVVAIKLLHAAVAADDDFAYRFQREAQAMAALSHKHIASVYAFDSFEDDIYYLAMEFIDGRPLDMELRELAQQNEMLPLTRVIEIIRSIADALAYAHEQGIVHRDIKPGNIMLAYTGRAVLTDFGIAKLNEARFGGNQTMTGALIGTPAYMSPEQAMGQRIDGRSDIYSLGVLFFRMVTGKMPFESESPTGILLQHISDPVPLPISFNPKMPLRLQDVILRMLAKKPDDRYRTASELVEVLATLDLRAEHQAEGGVGGEGDFLGDTTPTPFTLWQTTNAQTSWRMSQRTAAGFTMTQPMLPPPFQLPPRIPHMTGREAQLTELQAQLVTERPVGLLGLGGVGKSAMAVSLAYDIREQFPDGILWAHLDVSTPEAELVSFATAFGQTEAIGQQPDLPAKADFVRNILHNKKVLVVLDQAQDSEQVQWLMPTGTENRTLITTRNGKMLSKLDTAVLPVRPFTITEGLLYLERTLGEARVAAEPQAAKRIIEQIGGLPLALSIIAGFLQEAEDLTLSEYATLLQDEQTRLDNLADWEDEARNVASSFELSYQSLPKSIQTLFASLSVFDGPDFSSEAVAAVTKLPLAQVKLGLGRLFYLSLVGSDEDRATTDMYATDGTSPRRRYRLNPLLKIFARQKLTANLPQLQRRMAVYYANVAQQNSDAASFDVLDLAWQNVVGAMRWAYEQREWDLLIKGVLGLTKIHLGLIGFMDARGHWHEARQLLGWAKEGVARLGDPLLEARILAGLGGLAMRQADSETAVSHLQSSLNLLRDLPLSPGRSLLRLSLYDFMAQALAQTDRREALQWLLRGVGELKQQELSAATKHQRGYLCVQMSAMLGRLGQLDKGIEAAQRGLSLLPQKPTVAYVTGLINLGYLHYLTGNPKEGLRFFRRGVPLAQKLGHVRHLATLWLNIALVQELEMAFESAVNSLASALSLYQYMGDVYFETAVYLNLGKIEQKQGKLEKALANLNEAVTIAETHELTQAGANAHSILVDVRLVQKDIEQAIIHWRAVHDLSQKLELPHLRATIVRQQAQILRVQQQIDTALQQIEQAIALAQESKDAVEEGICWRVKGQILTEMGQHNEAKVAWQESISLLTDRDVYELGQTETIFKAAV